MGSADKTKGKARPGIKYKEKFQMGADCVNCRQCAWLKSSVSCNFIFIALKAQEVLSALEGRERGGDEKQ